MDPRTPRQPSRIAAALLLVLGLTACGSDDPESLTVYSGRSEKLVGPIFEAFTADTGIALDVRYGSSNDLALLLSEEGTKTPADVFLSRSPGPAGYLDDLGMLAKLDDDVLDRVAATDRSPAGTWVGFAGRGRVLVYNVDEVTTEVDSQQDDRHELEIEEKALPVDKAHSPEEGSLEDVDEQEEARPHPDEFQFLKTAGKQVELEDRSRRIGHHGGRSRW